MRFDYAYYHLLIESLLEKHQPATFLNRLCVTAPKFILRHDIDCGLEFVGEMPCIEQDLGVCGTYFIQVASAFYNPFCPAQARVVEGTLRMGHRLGLHFDCVKDDQEIPANLLDESLEREMDICRRYFGPVDAVSFHQPSAAVIDNLIKISYINTYDTQDMAGFEYFSDSRQHWSKGDPIEYVSAHPDKSFQILVHPFLWGDSTISFPERAVEVICSKAQALYDYDRKHSPAAFAEPLRCIFVRKEA